MTNTSIGGCGKHKGQSLIDCPLCATETKTFQTIILEHDLTDEEKLLCSNYLIAMKLTKAKINPNELMNVVNNWDRIKKAIAILNHNFNT